MMEVTKVVTSVFVLCLSGPTFGYPFTRSNLFSADSANDLRGQGPSQHQLPSHLEDYLANYVQGNQQYPQYQPQQQQQQQQQQPGYYQQQQQGPYQLPQTKLTAETLAALLPYLSSSSSSFSNLNGGDVGSAAASSSDYGAYPDYPEASQAYTDDEGTWYDDQAYNNQPTQQDEEQVALQLLLDHLNGRYSLDDLEAMEREAEMEENTESQLQSLMNKKMSKKSVVMPVMEVHSGQKEEAPLMPATSVRRPVWQPGQQQQQQQHQQQQHEENRQVAAGEALGVNTEVKRSSDVQGATAAEDLHEVHTDDKISDSASSSSSSSTADAASESSTASPSDDDSSSSSDNSSEESEEQEDTTMTPRLQTAYDALKKYLDRERKFRQDADDLAEVNEELEEPSSRGIQKRSHFAPDEESLSQQLANLKKTRT